jgi:hypothetical protein
MDRIRHWRLSGQGEDDAVQLWLSEKDSQLLFWSLPKQVKILIVSNAPSSHTPNRQGPVDGAAQR